MNTYHFDNWIKTANRYKQFGTFIRKYVGNPSKKYIGHPANKYVVRPVNNRIVKPFRKELNVDAATLMGGLAISGGLVGGSGIAAGGSYLVDALKNIKRTLNETTQEPLPYQQPDVKVNIASPFSLKDTLSTIEDFATSPFKKTSSHKLTPKELFKVAAIAYDGLNLSDAQKAERAKWRLNNDSWVPTLYHETNEFANTFTGNSEGTYGKSPFEFFETKDQRGINPFNLSRAFESKHSKPMSWGETGARIGTMFTDMVNPLAGFRAGSGVTKGLVNGVYRGATLNPYSGSKRVRYGMQQGLREGFDGIDQALMAVPAGGVIYRGSKKLLTPVLSKVLGRTAAGGPKAIRAAIKAENKARAAGGARGVGRFVGTAIRDNSIELLGGSGVAAGVGGVGALTSD